MQLLARFDPFVKSLLMTIISIFLVVGVMSKGAFVDSYNLQSTGLQVPEIALPSVAMMSRNSGIDLSLVGIANLTSIVGGFVALSMVGEPAPLAFKLDFIACAVATGEFSLQNAAKFAINARMNVYYYLAARQCLGSYSFVRQIAGTLRARG